MNWLKTTLDRNNFKYDANHCKLIDIDSVISTIDLSFNPRNNMSTFKEHLALTI